MVSGRGEDDVGCVEKLVVRSGVGGRDRARIGRLHRATGREPNLGRLGGIGVGRGQGKFDFGAEDRIAAGCVLNENAEVGGTGSEDGWIGENGDSPIVDDFRREDGPPVGMEPADWQNEDREDERSHPAKGSPRICIG